MADTELAEPATNKPEQGTQRSSLLSVGAS